MAVGEKEKARMKVIIYILFLSILLVGCSPNGDGKISRISTQASRDQLILSELEKQTQLLQEINKKLDK